MNKTVLTKPGAGKETLLLPKGVPGREYFLQVIAARDAVVNKSIWLIGSNPSLMPRVMGSENAKIQQNDVAAAAFMDATRSMPGASGLAKAALSPTVDDAPLRSAVVPEGAIPQPQPATETIPSALRGGEESAASYLIKARRQVDTAYGQGNK